MLSAHRYVAYTSDIGESFRPVAHPWLVRSAYGVSWAYLVGDVGYEGYKAYLRNERVKHPEKYLQSVAGSDKGAPAKEPVRKLGAGLTGGQSEHSAEVAPGRVPAIEDYRAVMAQRAVFQSIASMGLPAFTIHSVVRYSGRAMKDVKNVRLRTWGPIGVSALRSTSTFACFFTNCG
jgi:mitochondrial fission process protein 1